MAKEQQDFAWASLSKKARSSIKRAYFYPALNEDYNRGFNEAIEEILGKDNLTSDTEPEEMLMVERRKVQKLYESIHDDYLAADESLPYFLAQNAESLLKTLFGSKCLPDKEESTDKVLSALEHYRNTATPDQKANDLIKLEAECLSGEERPKPKLKVGDKVKILENATPAYHRGKIGTIVSEGVCFKGHGWILDLSKTIVFLESELEPYTEENKETMKENPSKSTPLDLCELLKGCVGECFYAIPYGEMELKEINKLELKPLHFSKDAINYLTKTDGRAYEDGSCIIYPSRALYEKFPFDAYSAWMEWKEARKPKRWRAKNAGQYWRIIFDESHDGYITNSADVRDTIDNANYSIGNYFRTEEEAKQAVEAVRETFAKFYENSNR
ncbi:MAG: hypothetical protein HDS59_05125 [Barnesiella sp.]|nr:hypothetical protein [Barnesiella sp.]